jgi:hypothetical protein
MPCLAAIGDARVVMIGEATHGTDEFYRVRMNITKALISEMGFNAVAIEGDWPDVYRINRCVTTPLRVALHMFVCCLWRRYVGGAAGSTDKRAEEALQDFKRFPQWMWRYVRSFPRAHTDTLLRRCLSAAIK